MIPPFTALILAAACAGADGSGGTVERDSAGIRIVENRHDMPAWTERTAWRLSDEPVLRIGAVSGDSSQLLHRVAHSRRLRDGRIAVVNTGTMQVRLYDREGNALGVIGGDGSLLFRSHYRQAQRPAGLSRNRIQMVRVLTDGTPSGSLGDYDDQTSMGGSVQYLFGPWAKETAAENTMWYGPGDIYEIREIDFDGNVVRLVRMDRPPQPDPDGRFLGAMTLRAGFRVHDIGSDYVLGVWQDDLDVEYVVMHAIEKP